MTDSQNHSRQCVREAAYACLALVAGFIFWFVLGGLT
jgi:hypothetical protein